jgi:transposase
MRKALVSDELWAVIEPLLPVEPAKPKGGRPRIPDRAALTGILFVLKSGIPWEMLPPELGCGSGMTCWRRLKAWHEAGVWARLHQVLLSRLAQAHKLDWSRACLDSSTVAAPLAKKGGKGKSGPTPQTVANRERSAILW